MYSLIDELEKYKLKKIFFFFFFTIIFLIVLKKIINIIYIKW